MPFNPDQLDFPNYNFRITEEKGKYFIFDELRKKDLLLTPEEWVRQHLVKFLIIEKKYPKSLIKLEGGLKINSLQKRTDILVYNKEGNFLLLAECKAPQIKITQEVFDQAARYNFKYRVDYLLVSNGLQHYCCCMDYKNRSYTFLPELPDYKVEKKMKP